ncbi:hypothetical protein CHLNCDRAFT_145220 [Chlorella variabilis]|uniref:CID domain-containing protein n=1 Tax=Chlorella variabilis TaxID=554065 RepID=E1ZDY6_CHLVA|nr:hypothetical protein CHLNCDRAFT_145220 [Chlorella variabilis]EFN55776.1 hypothetical protein CHLNCDRAFT_145220 [Chlorella variabilis]|eukprot:XP_005847878.1 hypothetical protein CHLNCDRAFT_145220 [Chlorella variabilis]
MAALQTQLVLAWAKALTELVTVEKKNIIALTEIARDALRSEPQSAPSLANLLTSRIVQAPPSQKLPVLYLLDSISKLVGEPYKTLFSPALPEAYMSTWQHGGAGLHRPLDKLLGTWSGVFPTPVLNDIYGRLAALRAAQAPLHVQQPAAAAAPNGYGGGGGGGFGYAPLVAAPTLGPPVQPMQPMAADPRLVQMQPPQQPGGGGYGQAAGPYQQQAGGAPYDAYPGPAPQPAYYQQQQQPVYQQPPAAAPLQQQAGPQVSVPDLLSSLMDAGLLSAPGMQPGAAAQPLASGGSGLLATPPYAAAVTATPPYAPAATATPEREQPASTRFTPERIKEPNPSAVSRLLRQTEATKSRFLDRKFLRRQQKAGGAAARASRLWYVDLDTWMASTVGAVPGGGGASGAVGAGRVAQQVAAAPPEKHSVPVDDAQTHCALSGEQFEQFWDEEHQEWRYRDARALGAEEAASYGLHEGAIVLVSALGRPDASVLQPAPDAGVGGGVLAQLQAQQEIAADLAAAAAAGEHAGGGEGDVKPGLKHALEEDSAEGEAPLEKRARLV